MSTETKDQVKPPLDGADGSEESGLAQLLDHCESAMEAAANYCPEDLAIALRNRARRCRSEARDIKNDFLRGYVCAVANHWLQHEDVISTRDLLGGAGSVDRILSEADPIDIETLRAAGMLPAIESPDA